MARLAHEFQVPIEAAALARIPHVEAVAPLIAAGVQILRAVHLKARVVRRKIARPDVLSLDAEASVLEILAREVVERVRVPILHGLAPERDDAPRISFPIEPYGVERLLDVRTIADGHEPLQVEGHLLASDADLELAAGQRNGVGDEGHP